MENNLRPNFEGSSSSHIVKDPSKNLDRDHPFPPFNPRNHCYSYEHELKKKMPIQLETPAPKSPALDWDPRSMLTNLSFLEQKIHQVQEMIHTIVRQEDQLSVRPNELAAQQQLVTTDLTCIIIQLISTAGSLLPSMKNTLMSSNPSIGQLGGVISSSSNLGLDNNSILQTNKDRPEYDELNKNLGDYGEMGSEPIHIEDHDVKDSEDGVDGENLLPGSYEVLQLDKDEILAPHTHFCAICGKGFKRDANLRMHMRGHGDEYKTPAALAKPMKDPSAKPIPIKRYSCPFVGCKRNKEHKKFQPLKTILCVKNHYKRSHCDKSYTCSRCNSKKFSVLADLKTHEKHCGRDKWLCSCGTTFSRKDKLFGHVALFQGHTPALPMDEPKGLEALGKNHEEMNEMESMGYIDDIDVLDIKGVDEDRGYFSPVNFDSCNFGGLDDFARQFDMGESSFSFDNFVLKNGENGSSSHLG